MLAGVGPGCTSAMINSIHATYEGISYTFIQRWANVWGIYRALEAVLAHPGS